MPNSLPAPEPPFPAGFRARYRSATVLDRARLLLHAKRRYEELHPETRHQAGQRFVFHHENSKVKFPHFEFSAARPTPDFTTLAASLLGRTRRTIQEIIRIAEFILPELQDALAETGIAGRKKDLLRITNMAPDRHWHFLACLHAGARPATLDALLHRVRNG